MRASRREALAMGAAAALAPASAWAAGWTGADYARAVVIDGLGWIDDPYTPFPPGRMRPELAAALRQSGATAFHMTVGSISGPDPFAATVDDVVCMDRFIRANTDLLLKATTAADIRRAKAEGKVAILYGFQDSSMIGANLDRIGTFASLGVRFIQPTYNLRTLWGDGAIEPADAGLSKLGRAAIARIEAERVLLDLSHGGRRTIAEGIAAATRPPIISHTGCRALHDHPRNTDDASMRALAGKGGVVGIYWMQFLVPRGDAMPADVIRHMAHAIDVCGEDHVGIGTDGQLTTKTITDAVRATQLQLYKDRTAQGIAAPGEQPGVFNIVAPWNSPRRFQLLAQALDRARWPARRIEKVLGANLQRLYAEAWDREP